MTASIVARDAQTGELGVAVFTAYPSVGMRVPFAQPGVGVVACQGMGDRSFGPRALRKLREGASAAEVVAQLVQADPATATRQVAVLSATGKAAGFTGESCVPLGGFLDRIPATLMPGVLAVRASLTGDTPIPPP